jgi:hypothetical protein
VVFGSTQNGSKIKLCICEATLNGIRMAVIGRIWTHCIIPAMLMRNLPNQKAGHLSVPQKVLRTLGHISQKGTVSEDK